MKKNLLLFVVLTSVVILASCSGGGKSKLASSANTAEVEKATEVIHYYNVSLIVLQKMIKEKEVNTILGYMEQKGKAPAIVTIAPPVISDKDTLTLLEPGNCFNEETREQLKQNYSGLFNVREQFYFNFDKYLSMLKMKNYPQTDQLLAENYRLSNEMAEYKQDIFDILSPSAEKAGQVLLSDNPMKEHIMAVRKMASTMQSIVNLYVRKPAFDGERIDHKLLKLRKQLNAAEKLPAVPGHDDEMKTYLNHLSQVKAFIDEAKKVREKGKYSDAGYEILTSVYGLSVI